jgi:hypothetical protein
MVVVWRLSVYLKMKYAHLSTGQRAVRVTTTQLLVIGLVDVSGLTEPASPMHVRIGIVWKIIVFITYYH